MNKLKLEPAAALNMLWGKKAFQGDMVQHFINHLDLSSGDMLYKKCLKICDWYEEVVLNRKYFINNYIDNTLTNSRDEYLIIILAAGKSPLSLRILNQHFDKVNKILEIDLAGMDEKKELYDKYFPDFSEKIKCITADISSKTLLSVLNSLLNEYYENVPCLIVLEGVVYFLSKSELKNIVSSFKSSNNNNQFIIEYLLPQENIAEEKRKIPAEIFSEIQKHSAIDSLNFYTNDVLKEIFESNGGHLLEVDNLMHIEKLRKGENKYFTKHSDGWIECSVWEL
jgi:O-methyltransferase involved in polyketide biosynthesis